MNAGHFPRKTTRFHCLLTVLLFAGTGGLLGVAAQAGRSWSIAAVVLFLTMAVLTFVQRAITGM